MTGDAAEDMPAEPEPFLSATRRLGPNSFQAWTVTERAGGQFDVQRESSVDGENWTDSARSGPFNSWQDAVRSDPTLTLLRSRQHAQFDIHHSEFELAELLTCDLADALVGWPANSVARIGNCELFFFMNGPGAGSMPLLTGAGAELIGDEIASYFSDAYHPGDFTETSSLLEYAPGVAVYLSESDADNDFTETAELVILSDTPGMRASGITEWIGSLRAIGQYAAMLELAVLDPYNHLHDEQRSEWETALTHPYSRVHFAIDGDTREALSALIVPTDIAEALEDPLGPAGQDLYERLMEDDSLAEMFL